MLEIMAKYPAENSANPTEHSANPTEYSANTSAKPTLRTDLP